MEANNTVNNTIEIHEFSTGIREERTADGGWVSVGFTGQYMNITLPSIPSAVENSINEKEFEVTEGAFSDEPAIIGRVVGSGEDTWSVVAVVTRGRDNVSRSFSVYRYFLCKGGNIEKILAWLESHPKIPTFNPFDKKIIGQSYPCPEDCPEYTPESSKVPDINFKDSEPTLLEPEKCNDFKILNFLAAKKSKENKQLVSWAYNVEALEKPRKFQLIQPASQRAYNILDKAIKNIPYSSPPIIMDEEAIKSAIRGLINSSQVKPEAVKKINEAVQNEQISNEYWRSLFDAQGAKIAISQKIYSPQMVRLITLRAMVIPKTLPEFMDWLNFKGNKSKLDDNQTASLNFQKEIRDLFMKEKLTDGIKFLLFELINKKSTPETIQWLLTVPENAWFTCRKKFFDDVFDDLELVAKQVKPISQTSFKCSLTIWQRLINNWKSIEYNNLPEYQPVANLFEQIARQTKEYQLCAYFYQVSNGAVPKIIFAKCKLEKHNICILGLKIRPKLTIFDNIVNFINQNSKIEHLPILLGFIILFNVINVVFRHEKHSVPAEKISIVVKDFSTQFKSLTNTTNICKIPNQNQKINLTSEADNKFDETLKSIRQLTNEFSTQNQDNYKPEEIDRLVLEQLNCENFKLEYFEPTSVSKADDHLIKYEHKFQLLEAIYHFQVNNKINPPNGIISDNPQKSNTYKKLKKQVEKKLNVQKNSNRIIELIN